MGDVHKTGLFYRKVLRQSPHGYKRFSEVVDEYEKDKASGRTVWSRDRVAWSFGWKVREFIDHHDQGGPSRTGTRLWGQSA